MAEQMFTRDTWRPKSFDDTSNSVRVIAVTENPVRVWDYEKKAFLEEILLVDGFNLPPSGKVPLLDSHNRNSVSSVLGSARSFQPTERNLECDVHFSGTDAGRNAAQNVREGHLSDFSVGYFPVETYYLNEGEARTIRGRTFQGPVKVTARWHLRELSLTPIGADQFATARSNGETLPAYDVMPPPSQMPSEPSSPPPVPLTAAPPPVAPETASPERSEPTASVQTGEMPAAASAPLPKPPPAESPAPSTENTVPASPIPTPAPRSIPEPEPSPPPSQASPAPERSQPPSRQGVKPAVVSSRNIAEPEAVLKPATENEAGKNERGATIQIPVSLPQKLLSLLPFIRTDSPPDEKTGPERSFIDILFYAFLVLMALSLIRGFF